MTNEHQAVINKAWHLLNAFDYGWVKKKNIVPLECGRNSSGQLDYILVCNRVTNDINYRFDYDAAKGWSMRSFLVREEA